MSALRNIARTGYVAKGVIYTITGLLTFMAAINIGGEKAGKEEVLDFIKKQDLGSTLLIVLAFGLLCYAIWRFAQAIVDPQGKKGKSKNRGQRFALFISGVSYVGLAGLAILTAGGKSGSSSMKHSSILTTEKGLWILAGIGLLFAGRGIYQITRIFKTNFIRKFDFESMTDERKRKIIKNSAYMGMTSRAIIFLIIGFFALKASFTANLDEIKTTSDVFGFIETSTWGSFQLGMISTGFVGYAVYMFLSAKYRSF
ncbi:uncharacterized protein DUF1206 [Gillisia sp. Hel_I_86]|uniref:DUF1206 domain-containing protein n=1 Tax=Gillisia sp. Hel_I_86 TaxID=1249981 RepID=UPI00119A371A|nr:DUF1206 domain-containing protein [Gillisia sp. Hel_I_86]TVZ28470.1 uncharacterized protein DUF1206 [Gillisia sp. Hel_I_86]